ncbi:hypothetical protein ACLOJK_024765 [Asimina triloba]
MGAEPTSSASIGLTVSRDKLFPSVSLPPYINTSQLAPSHCKFATITPHSKRLQIQKNLINMGFEKKLVKDVSGWLKLYDDGSVDRTWTGPPEVNFLISRVPPSAEFVDGVATHDVVVDPPKSSSFSVRVYVPERLPGDSVASYPVLLHFHGGGFCISHPDWYMYYQFYERLVREARAICVSVYQRLAPEHRLPAAVDDGCAALLWLRSVARGERREPALEDADFSRVFLVGDSSGGNLVHEVAARAGKEELSPLRLAGGIPIHPGFVRVERSKSELEQEPSPMLTLEMVDSFLALALPEGSTKDHPITCPMGEAAPPLGKVKLPPFLVVVAEKDMIRDTELEYVEAMKKGGKEVEVLVNAGMGHSFYLNKMAVDLDPETGKQTQLLIQGISDFMKRRSLPKTLAGA